MKFTNRRIIRPVLLLLIVLTAAAGLQSQTAAALKEISLQKEGNKLNVLFKVEGTYTVEASFLPNPPRLVIDLTPINQLTVLPYTQIDDIGVLDIRTGQFKPDTARIVFDLSQNVPAYNVSQLPDGVRVSFWYEGEVPPIQAPVKEQPATRTAAPTAAALIPAEAGPGGVFISAKAGMALFIGSDLLVNKSFDMYGETATLEEAYGSGFSPMYELQVGKYDDKMKYGIGLAFWSHKQRPIITADLPHPFLMNAYRTVELEAADVKNPLWNFTAFALFSLVKSDKVTLWAGPMLGLTKGTFQTVEDLTFSEVSPFTAADVTVSNYVFFENLYTELLFGALLNFEFNLGERVRLVADLRAAYINPIITSVTLRANLLHIIPMVGIQYNF